MQQLEMISHIDSTMILLPNCVKVCLRRVLKKLGNKLPHKCGRYGKKDDKIKNCQIVGADVNPNQASLRDAEKQLERLSSYYGFVHFRLPDYIMRLIYDRHKEYVTIYLYIFLKLFILDCKIAKLRTICEIYIFI